MAEIRVVSSLNDVADALQDLQKPVSDEYEAVQFELDEEAPLQDAANLKAKSRPGKLGFTLINPELLECKYDAKMALETAFHRVLDASIERIDQELVPIEQSIAILSVYVRYDEHQIPQNGPHMAGRNRGVQHVIYPCPPFPSRINPEYDTQQERVPYLYPYAQLTPQERAAAIARDRRAQMAAWQVKLRILQVRQSILKEQKTLMLARMRTEFKTMMEERSNLGCGFAEYEFPPLA